MSQEPSSSLAFDPKEPIPGYRTTELIGRGGYGEVWRAIAPGGLAKAVKIVHGDADMARAAVEMKALARIKDVRHPLLLSIERIEITGGNLVIITELADCSLKDHYLRKKANSVGIPQNELLHYLSDAAEALDFLYTQFSLQHLDIKPENILLLAGRAKVGDFGLVKNLYERGNSVVGGLTPTYSSPELFDGKPSRHSDQYSLAIVYTQMLTGVLPFNGNNTAQMAAQHLHGVPDLSALPRRQRPVIARALSKDSSQRFESCLQMIAALKTCVMEAEAEQPRPDHGSVDKPQAGASRSMVVDRARAIQTNEMAAADESGRRARAGNAGRERGANRDPQGSEAGEQPIVIVGIGGTAVQVLGKLVDRLHDRIGDENCWPPIQIVLMDSDIRTLTARFDKEGRYVQLVPIRLRSADTFGPRSQEILQWLSRRWFYGIPRDLTTAHYRPLGRLALITHAARVKEAIRAAIAGAVDRTAERSQPRPDGSQPALQSPRVIVLGSISGGTGGGAILDVAYAVRSELKRRGLSDDDVNGVLLHSTPRGNVDRDKAVVNAYATLTELHHYSRPGSNFPGETSLGALPFHGDNATFGQTHVLKLGAGLSEQEWETATEKAAEFVYCSTFTPASQILDEWQALDRQRAGDAEWRPSAWSCDFLAFGVGNPEVVSAVARRTCVDVVSLWREGLDAATEGEGTLGPTALMTAFASRSTTGSARINAAVKQKLAECGLVLYDFLRDSVEVMKLELETDENAYVRRLVEEALNVQSDRWRAESERIDAIVAAIDQVLRSHSNSKESEVSGGSLYDRIVTRLAVRGSGRATALLEWIRGMVDAPAVRVEGARQFATAAKSQLQEMHERLMMQATELRQTAQAVGVEARGTDGQRHERSRLVAWAAKKGPHEHLREILNNYAGIRLKETLYCAMAKQMRLIEAELATLIYQLDNLSRNLKLLAERLQESDDRTAGTENEAAPPAAGAAVRFQQIVTEQLTRQRRNIARNVEQAIDQRLFGGTHGLRRFLEPESELWKTLGGPLTEASRRAGLDCLKEIVCRLMQGTSPESSEDGRDDVDNVILQGLASETHESTEGDVGRILIVPADIDPATLRKRLGSVMENVMIVSGSTCDIALCTVHKNVTLERVAHDITGGVPLFQELASRLHTRIDVQWSPLSDCEPDFCRQSERVLAPAAGEGEPVTPTAMIALPKPTLIANSVGAR